MINYPVAVGSVQTRIIEAGDGPDVAICIHGIGSRADRFTPLLEPLAHAGYRVLALDLPGHGFADKGDLPLSIPFYAEYIIGLMRQLDLNGVTIVGTSLGGNIGGYMLRQTQPGEVRRLVMVGTLGVVPIPEADLLNISRVILRNRSIEDCRGKLRALIYDDTQVTDDWAREESTINNSRGADESFAILGSYFENEINNHLVLDDLLRTDVELGLMWGTHDLIVDPPTGRQCMQALPAVPMVWVNETGHAPYRERPDAFVDGMATLFDPARDNGRLETWV